MQKNDRSGCLGVLVGSIARFRRFLKTRFGAKSPQTPGNMAPPYHLRDDFLSKAELSFYHVMRQAVTDWATVCTKVSLGDLFFAQTGDYGKNRGWMNRIDRKHVDFLLCDPETMYPVLGVELDDSSHARPERQERDAFVDKVFEAACLPIIHIPARYQYNPRELAVQLHEAGRPGERSPNRVSHQGGSPAPKDAVAGPPTSPLCPKCGAPMTIRTVQQEGRHHGKQFWACTNFPKCRGAIWIDQNS